MRYVYDHDYHIHSYLSTCSKDENQNSERILKYALDNGLKSICITDHFWDKDVNGTPTLASQLMADAYFNSEQMWTYWPEVGDITNRSGLAMIPTGYASLGITPAVKSAADYPNAKFEGLFDYSVFWTSSEVEGEEGMAYYRYIYGNQPHFMIGKGSKEAFGASVRCVRDSK